MTWKLFYNSENGVITSCSKAHLGDTFIEIDDDDALDFMRGKVPMASYRIFDNVLTKLIVESAPPKTTSNLEVIANNKNADFEISIIEDQLHITMLKTDSKIMHYLTVTPTITIYVCEKDNLQYLLDTIEIPSSSIMAGGASVFFGNHTNYDLVSDISEFTFSLNIPESILTASMELIDKESDGDIIIFKKTPSGIKITSSIKINETLMISIENIDGTDSVMTSLDLSTGKSKLVKFNFSEYHIYANINSDKVSVI